ncbi:hypothetical protein SUNI508_12984 [Seiridium unicorne]|uniref:GST N-terminal domain-containing protein n=1 Tax=Seiridium unicorne TaxID=138068 RepID=A0ABR2VEV1_9PEZI
MAAGTSTLFKPNLYVLSWGLYPRRITIYLKEKDIFDNINIIDVPVTTSGLSDVPGKPKGTVPILEHAPGRYIHQSCTIMEYLEDIFPQAPIMRGSTPEARARTHELLDLSNEACSLLSFHLHNGIAAFAGAREAEPRSSRSGHGQNFADPDGPYLGNKEDHPGLADVVLLAIVQFAREIYGIDLSKDHKRIATMVGTFEKRESAKWDEAPTEFVKVARNFIVKYIGANIVH